MAPVPACSQRLSSRAVSTVLCCRLIYAWSVTRPHRLYLSHHKTVFDEHRLFDRYSFGWGRSLVAFSPGDTGNLTAGPRRGGDRGQGPPGCDVWLVMGHLATVTFSGSQWQLWVLLRASRTSAFFLSDVHMNSCPGLGVRFSSQPHVWL